MSEFKEGVQYLVCEMISGNKFWSVCHYEEIDNLFYDVENSIVAPEDCIEIRQLEK